ncbi:MAG: molecular chaperone HscC [Caulobacter sp.]|nr:molecular chaperone HscC [Caulobacter sp.]
MIIGIDLGTTNSAVAIWRDGKAELIRNSLGHVLTPSAVSVDDAGQIIIGLAARERQSTHPFQTSTAFKRYMGSARTTRLGDRDFLPEELSALVLRALKADAEAFLGEPVTEAVITVPAYFNDKQRKATRRAGELAGLKVERLLNEPTAAALAYGIHTAGQDNLFLVFDLGGGTFDVSILEMFEGVIEVRASTGDNRLGGEDFNELLITAMRAKFGARWREAAQAGDAIYELLRAAAERTRRALSAADSAMMSITWEGEVFELEITAQELETMAAPLLARLREPVLRSLRDSEIAAENLREIVMVGGATQMPIVRRAVTRMFGRFPATSINPDEAVAIGAAIQAGLKARDAALGEVVLTDVCPYTLGVDTVERLANGSMRHGIFAPIIDRNTVIPASRVELFSTVQDSQREVHFNIFQGESRQVSDNVKLGSIAVPVPPKRAGEVQIEVRFTYDINGLLEVDARVLDSGEKRQLVIVDDEHMSREDVEARRAALAALKVHPRDDHANLALLARAGRCYEDFIADRRDYVGRLIAQFETALETQNPRTVESGRLALAAALDELEGEVWL